MHLHSLVKPARRAFLPQALVQEHALSAPRVTSAVEGLTAHHARRVGLGTSTEQRNASSVFLASTVNLLGHHHVYNAPWAGFDPRMTRIPAGVPSAMRGCTRIGRGKLCVYHASPASMVTAVDSRCALNAMRTRIATTPINKSAKRAMPGRAHMTKQAKRHARLVWPVNTWSATRAHACIVPRAGFDPPMTQIRAGAPNAILACTKASRANRCASPVYLANTDSMARNLASFVLQGGTARIEQQIAPAVI